MDGELMFVIQANWKAGHLQLWAESLEAFSALSDQASNESDESGDSDSVAVATKMVTTHKYTVASNTLLQALKSAGIDVRRSEEATLQLQLPSDLLGPWPSDRLVSIMGNHEQVSDPILTEYSVPTVAVHPSDAIQLLNTLANHACDEKFEVGLSVRFWASAAQLTLDLLVDQRFIPTLLQVDRKHLTAKWSPWLHDEEVVERFSLLLRAMPPIARATTTNGRVLLESAIEDMTNGLIRDILIEDDFVDAVDEWNPSEDAHVAWLSALLHEKNAVVGNPDRLLSVFTDARRWLGRLCDVGEDLSWRLLLELHEPVDGTESWTLTFALQSAEDVSREVSAVEVWGESGSEGGSDDRLPELFLNELDRAAMLYPKLESSLEESTPSELQLSTVEAHRFLVEYLPLLEESGFRTTVPLWWGSEQSTLSANLHIDSPSLEVALADRAEGSFGSTSVLGLNAIVECRWQVAVGGHLLTQEEFEELLKQKQPLVQVQGKWVHLQKGAIEEAKRLFIDGAKTEMQLLEALRLAQGDGETLHTLSIGGLTATGWVHELLESTTDSESLPEIQQPPRFEGQLRPYQLTGLRWMAFLSKFGIGTCLADDMGLGKTIQLIALLQHERSEDEMDVGTTLLVVPTSVIGNWERELDKFSPNSKCMYITALIDPLVTSLRK